MLLGNILGRLNIFVYGTVTLCGLTFQTGSTNTQLCNFLAGPMSGPRRPTTPLRQLHRDIPPQRFGLTPVRSPLLRRLLLLSFPPGTEMFQFPEFPLPAICVLTGVIGHYPNRVSPLGDPGINAR